MKANVKTTIQIEKINFSTLPLDSYSFSKRVSAKELIDMYVTGVKDAQDAYNKKLSDVTELFKKNLRKCQEMDAKLGCSADIENLSEDNEENLKGKQLCPIHSCGTKTVKLKRHLALHKLSEEQITYALKCSRIFTENSTTEYTEPRKRISNTNLINRKQNYKLCKICKKLYMNISDHLKTTHKLNRSDPNYETLVKTCEVVPRCYTKKVGGRATALNNEALEEAKAKHEEKIKSQQSLLKHLKSLRNEKKEVSKRIKENPTVEDEEKLQELESKYLEERNKDSTIYPERVELWRASFLEHLTIRGDNNPKRGVSMAMEVLYPGGSINDITIEDLLDVRKIRQTLQEFKAKENTNSTSKMKYIKYFQSFITFITTDFSSPEFSELSSNEELIAKDIKLKTVTREIETVFSNLSKNRGKDLIVARERAQKRLVDKEESDVILKETGDFLKDFETEESVLNSYDAPQIRRVRDNLIVAACIRLARRSKEIMSLTISEFEQAEDCEIEGEPFKIISPRSKKCTSRQTSTYCIYRIRVLCRSYLYQTPATKIRK